MRPTTQSTTQSTTQHFNRALRVVTVLVVALAAACTSGSDDSGPASCEDIALAVAQLRVANVTRPSSAADAESSADSISTKATGPQLSEEEAARHAKQIADAIGPHLSETCSDLTSTDRRTVHSCLTDALETAHSPDRKSTNASSSARCLALR